MIAAPLRFKHLLWVLAGVVALYASYGVWVVAIRLQYPYDHLIWAESPFLTNMLKLHTGVELFGPAADANSFVYSPALEYICYALLSPFDLHLNLRACKVVNVGIGVAAIMASGRFMLSVLDETRAALPRAVGFDRTAVILLLTSAAGLVLLKNLAFDICHPDNLHALHLAGGLALAHHAMKKERFELAVFTAALLGFGILLKQTCALGGFGVALYLALYGRRHWGWKKSALVVLAAVVTTAIGGWWLLIHHDHGRFWLLDVLLKHPKSISKIDYLWAFEAGYLHRAPLYIGAALFCMRGVFSDDEKLRTTTGLWLFAGLFGVAPALSAYAKEFGIFNNIIVIDLWAALLVVPSLINLGQTHLAPSNNAEESSVDTKQGIVAATALAAIALGLYPTKRAPLRDHYRYGQELEAALRADVAAGRKVLVAHGTAAWIRAGLRTVPLDRANTVLELQAARQSRDAHTARRITDREYDRIYVAWPRYSEHIEVALKKNYRIDSTIKPVKLLDVNTANGWSVEMVAPIVIYRPKRSQ